MKLQTKISMALVPPVLVFIAALGWISVTNTTEELHESAERYLNGVLETYISHNLAERQELLKLNNLDEVPSFVEAYQREAAQSSKHIKLLWPGHIFALNVDSGELVFDSTDGDKSELEKKWKPMISEYMSQASGTHSHIDNEIHLGRYFEPWHWFVIIAIDDEQIHQAVLQIRNATIIIAVLSTASIILILSLIFRKFIVDPVNRIRLAAAEIARERPIESIDVYTDDELGNLARDIEKMSGDIFESRLQLTQLNEALEFRVEERTMELHQSNQSLHKEVAERKRAVKALRESEELFRAVFDSSKDGIVVWDVEGNFLYLNRSLPNWFPHGTAWTIGRNIRDTLEDHPEIRDLWTERIKRVQDRKEVLRDVDEWQFENQTVYTETVLFPVKDEYDKAFAVGGIYRDITRRREMEKIVSEHALALEKTVVELERKNKELDEFTYIASHDLQEPLRKMIAFSKLLKQDVGDELAHDAQTDLNYIVDAASRLQNLVQALLTLSRTGRTGMNAQPLEMSECVDDALLMLQAKLEDTEAKIIRDDLPVVIGDKTLLAQLYQNLIGNALKFSNKNSPEIHLTVMVDNGVTVFGVKDNGIGLKPEYSEQIFAPFKRLHGQSEYEGTGIGLAICRKIVDRHGGRIWVESIPDQGAHFKFILGDGTREKADEKD